jgi:hypothetical protein
VCAADRRKRRTIKFVTFERADAAAIAPYCVAKRQSSE